MKRQPWNSIFCIFIIHPKTRLHLSGCFWTFQWMIVLEYWMKCNLTPFCEYAIRAPERLKFYMAIISVFPQTITVSRPVLRAHCNQLYIYMKGSDDIYLDSYCEVREKWQKTLTVQRLVHTETDCCVLLMLDTESLTESYPGGAPAAHIWPTSPCQTNDNTSKMIPELTQFVAHNFIVWRYFALSQDE